MSTWADWNGPTEPGTYEVTDVESSWATCGLCVQLFEMSGGNVTKTFMPVPGSGTITLDSVFMGDDGVGQIFSGSLDCDFQEVTISDADSTTTPVEDGCSGSAAYAWSETCEALPINGLPAEVGDAVDNYSFLGYIDSDGDYTVEETEVTFDLESIGETGKKTLVVYHGATW